MARPREPLDPALPACLADPSAYPDDASAAAGIEQIQTHLSYVFLTGERVYKVRKSVDVGFISFLEREARNRDCLRELHLNRRLSPDVYLGIAPLVPAGDGFVVGAVDPVRDPATSELPAREHCVVMRRIAAGRDASTLLDTGVLQPEWLERLADRIADFHAHQGLGRPSPFSQAEWRERIWKPVVANFDSLDAQLPDTLRPSDLESLRARAGEEFERLAPAFEARRCAGRAVDAHGDLHLEHVWFERDDGKPVVIDCLEFDDALRRIDAASEVAFLAMDLGFRGRADLGERWLGAYAAASDDFHLYTVVDFFASYRAAVRAKVEAIAALDVRIPSAQRRRSAELARDRVLYADRALDARTAGSVHLVGGVIGAGKSSAARVLAEAIGAVVISSDRVRKDDYLARGQPGEGAAWESGSYTPAARDRIYDAVLERAEAVIGSGRPVVLDASWSSAERRARARAWAAALSARSVFVEVRCGREETLRRLEERSRRGSDASEAGAELYDRFAAAFDPIGSGEWPLADRFTVHTDSARWRWALRERGARPKT